MFELIDKTITNVYITEDRYRLAFKTTEDLYYLYGVDADCCSETWYAELNGYSSLQGAQVLEVDTSSFYSSDADPIHDCLQSYGIKFRTNKGYVDIVYRNASNGYYGGNFTSEGTVTELPKKKWDSKAKEKWEEIKEDFTS